MNKPLEKAIYKYLQEYKKQVCENCIYKGSITCDIANRKIGCLLKDRNEKKMCIFIATRLTTIGGER